jgi:hypothetical protein
MISYVTERSESERIRQIYINEKMYTEELNSLKVNPSETDIINVIICDNDRAITKKYVIDFIKKYMGEYIILYTVRSSIKQITPIVKVTERVIELVDKLFRFKSEYIQPDFNEILKKVMSGTDEFEILEKYTKIIYVIV